MMDDSVCGSECLALFNNSGSTGKKRKKQKQYSYVFICCTYKLIIILYSCCKCMKHVQTMKSLLLLFPCRGHECTVRTLH